MAESYPRRDQARGIWKINDITKNIKEVGTYPQQGTQSRALIQLSDGSNDSKNVDVITIPTAGNATDSGDVAQGGRNG